MSGDRGEDGFLEFRGRGTQNTSPPATTELGIQTLLCHRPRQRWWQRLKRTGA